MIFQRTLVKENLCMSSLRNEYLNMIKHTNDIDAKEKLSEDFVSRLFSCKREFEFKLGEFEALSGLLTSRVTIFVDFYTSYSSFYSLTNENFLNKLIKEDFYKIVNKKQQFFLYE